ncbi:MULTISPECIES: DUF6074 family protein [unclassified Mesorhizobium]|uniref:DUF6074 family protein n=1 Tax=unclassified Mesorhizobium TaxID=325217 RepID=UPI00333DEB4B
MIDDSNISAFPLHRRRKLVEGIARVLESKNGEDANAFWRTQPAKGTKCGVAG